MLQFAEGRATAQWDHTASVLSMLFNINRGKNKAAATVEDFHPYREKRRPKMTREDLHGLKGLFENWK